MIVCVAVASSSSFSSEELSENDGVGSLATVAAGFFFGGGPDDPEEPLPIPLFFFVVKTRTLAEVGVFARLFAGTAAFSDTLAVKTAISPIGGWAASSSSSEDMRLCEFARSSIGSLITGSTEMEKMKCCFCTVHVVINSKNLFNLFHTLPAMTFDFLWMATFFTFLRFLVMLATFSVVSVINNE